MSEICRKKEKFMLTDMKRIYLIPTIRIQAVDAEDDVLEMSLPVFDEKNPNTEQSSEISNGAEILVNQHSVWDEE